MKTITLFFVFIISVNISAADINQSEINLPGVISKGNISYHDLETTTAKVDAATTICRLNSNPDTLSYYLDRASQAVVYTYNIQGSDFPIVGSNTFYLMLGQKFTIDPDKTLKGILVPYYFTQIQGSPDSLSIVVMEIDPQTGFANGQPIAQTVFTLENVVSSQTNPVFTFFPIPGDAVLPEHFVVFIQTRVGTNQDDGQVIFSSMQGDGRGENNACFITYDQQTQTTIMANLAQLPLVVNNNPLDFDALILPVVDFSSGVDDIDGGSFSIKTIYPNPASDIIIVEGITADSNLEFEILDMNGKTVKIPERNHERNGSEIIIRTTGLPSGSYILKISDGRSFKAGVIKITK